MKLFYPKVGCPTLIFKKADTDYRKLAEAVNL